MKSDKFKTELLFTEIYKKHIDDHPAIREAMCLKVQYPEFFTQIQDEDLFAGRIKNTLVGITPDEWGTAAFGYYCVKDKILKELEHQSIDDETRKKVWEMVEFWSKESTSAKLRAAYTDEMKKYLPSDDWMHQCGIAFPLYRLTGGNVNWEVLLKKGIPGLIKDAEEARQKAASKNKEPEFYEGIKIALEVLVNVCHWYAKQAIELRNQTKDEKRREELRRIADTLEIITVSAPKTMREAIQLFWLYSYAGDIRNYGRMDVWLGDFLVNDLESGILNEDEALKLLQSLWRLIGARNTIVHSRIIIGGKGRRNEVNADRFALLAMEASRTVNVIEPQLSLRFYEGMNPALMEKALQVIGEGRTFPILYNDEVNLKAVQLAQGFDELTAEQFVPYGCGEYIIEHKSFGTPSSVVNLLKALEVTLHNGIDPMTGKISGLQLGTFEDFKAGEHSPYLYMSLLYDDCFEKGKGMFAGGIRYLSGTLETYGNTNTADSLTAIKKLVYEKEVISKDELLKALDSNFVGYEKIRQQLLKTPKYGNDNEIADQMLVNVHEHVCNYVKDQAGRVGLQSFLVVVINNSANTLMGHQTSASADGRKSGEPMANGNNPSGGSDVNGPTAFLNSLVKPSPYIHAGAVQNMKFSKEMFTNKKEILKSLLETFFELKY